MSANNQTIDPSTSNFTAIFEAASNEYKALTRQDLATHPFAGAFDISNSPDSVLNVFRKQAQAFDTFRKGDEKLIACLTPIVNILFTFSATLGEGISLVFSPANTIFTGIGLLIGVVRDVIASYEILVNLFERIQFFLQRLDHYTAVPLTPDMTELLGKVMAQVLSILGISSKVMKEGRIKTFLKRLVGKTDVENALQRLDMLTKEENLLTAARNLRVAHRIDQSVTAIEGLTHDVRDNVNVIKEDTRDLNDNVKVTKRAMDDLQRNQLRDKLRTWLAPPNPSINHNTACDTQHDGTATWFIRGSTFDQWKNNGSLLWIRGNPGSGKSILCSAIIEDIKHMRESRSALIAYYYFDFKDASKRDIRGLLASLILQVADDSDSCWDILSQLHNVCRNGSEQPTEAALTQCLKSMLGLLGQIPIYIIIDALDECPNNTGTPSAREKVLNFVEDLICLGHPNLFICITSRPEQDVQSVLNPLTTPSQRMSLHEEGGQREDINNYVRSFVQNDSAMRRWRLEDKELVISILSERAAGMFRWVYCQLDNLRRCMPSSILRALDELPITLDDTYERILQSIPRAKSHHAHQLLQCLVAAIRPLRVEELAEIFAIKFGSNAAPNLMEGWRPGNPEEAVLSACSTLISIITDGEGSKIVQFSHFSVKEFLTSDRLQTSDVTTICQYYIPLEPAHTILARACLTTLLQLDEKVDKTRLGTFPLAFYAAQHWVDHAKFGDVASQIEDFMEDLFNPKKPYFRAWTWIHDVESDNKRSIGDLGEHPLPPYKTPLYYAVFCGFSWLAKHLIVKHKEDINALYGFHGTLLHGASHWNQCDAARVLLDHGAEVNARGDVRWTPLHFASSRGNAKMVELLLEHEALVNAQTEFHATPLWLASGKGHLETVRVLLDHGADANIRRDSNLTPLQIATKNGHRDVAQLLLEHGAECA